MIHKKWGGMLRGGYGLKEESSAETRLPADFKYSCTSPLFIYYSALTMSWAIIILSISWSLGVFLVIPPHEVNSAVRLPVWDRFIFSNTVPLFSHDGRMNSMAAMNVWGTMDRRYEVIWWMKPPRGDGRWSVVIWRYEVIWWTWLASWWWWQMVCGDVAMMWQQVRTHKQKFGENNKYARTSGSSDKTKLQHGVLELVHVWESSGKLPTKRQGGRSQKKHKSEKSPP